MRPGDLMVLKPIPSMKHVNLWTNKWDGPKIVLPDETCLVLIVSRHADFDQAPTGAVNVSDYCQVLWRGRVLNACIYNLHAVR